MLIKTLFVLAQNRAKISMSINDGQVYCAVFIIMKINKLLRAAMWMQFTNIIMSKEATVSRDYILAYFIYRNFTTGKANSRW